MESRYRPLHPGRSETLDTGRCIPLTVTSAALSEPHTFTVPKFEIPLIPSFWTEIRSRWLASACVVVLFLVLLGILRAKGPESTGNLAWEVRF